MVQNINGWRAGQSDSRRRENGGKNIDPVKISSDSMRFLLDPVKISLDLREIVPESGKISLESGFFSRILEKFGRNLGFFAGF